MKLDVRSFALACGLVLGLGIFVMTWWIIVFEGQAPSNARPPFLGLIYRGYSLTSGGSVYGLLWGFADGAAGGAVFAWLYNRLASGRASA